ncbi:MAG: hypothetical protein AAFP90_19415, partial [Planctomycetota bacterium]
MAATGYAERLLSPSCVGWGESRPRKKHERALSIGTRLLCALIAVVFCWDWQTVAVAQAPSGGDVSVADDSAAKGNAPRAADKDQTGSATGVGAATAPVPPTNDGDALRRFMPQQPIEPGAWLLLDNGSRVVLPDMTFEQFDRMRRIAEGTLRPEAPFRLESLDVRGRVTASRGGPLNKTTPVAALEVQLRFLLQSVAGESTGRNAAARSLEIPIGMKNLFRSGAADLTLISASPDSAKPTDGSAARLTQDDFRVVVDASGNHRLWLRESTRLVTGLYELRFSALANVVQEPTTQLVLDLPNVISDVRLSIAEENLAAIVDDRDDVLVAIRSTDVDSSEIRLRGSGGLMRLRWTATKPAVRQKQILEAETRARLVFSSGNQRPICSGTVNVTNVNGTLQRFQISLPVGGRIASRTSAAFEAIPINLPDDAPAPQQSVYQITTAPGRAARSVEIPIEIEFESAEFDESAPLWLPTVQVEGAIRQTVSTIVQCDATRRLRWRSPTGVTVAWNTETATPDTRQYQFD